MDVSDEEPPRDPAVTRRKMRRLARLVVWVLAIASVWTGIALTVSRTVTVWEPVDGSAGTYAAHPVDVTGVGLALLVVGLVILAALLILEGYGRSDTER
ncbi:hypothetical protein ACWH95_05065 [Microbacterium sp. NPDC055502]